MTPSPHCTRPALQQKVHPSQPPHHQRSCYLCWLKFEYRWLTDALHCPWRCFFTSSLKCIPLAGPMQLDRHATVRSLLLCRHPELIMTPGLDSLVAPTKPCLYSVLVDPGNYANVSPCFVSSLSDLVIPSWFLHPPPHQPNTLFCLTLTWAMDHAALLKLEAMWTLPLSQTFLTSVKDWIWSSIQMMTRRVTSLIASWWNAVKYM